MKTKRRGQFWLLTALLICLFAMAATTSAADVPIDATTFPDETFRTYVSSNFDKDKNGSLSETEIAGVTLIDVRNKGITSLEGVEYFTALETLDCIGNALTSLDVSGLTSLENLQCMWNTLTSLDVSGCTSLKYLNCSHYAQEGHDGNALTSLDVGSCTSLERLFCTSNALTSLDVSGCTLMKELYCTGNALTSLDVSGLTSLETLRCMWATLTSLDASGCTSLVTIECGWSKLVSLDVSSCTALVTLNCYYSALTSLDVSSCTGLKSLDCGGNALTSLDVSSCTALESLDCGSNALTSLDVSSCTALEALHCGGNALTSLNVSDCTELIELDCSSNDLTSLDVSSCTGLKWLNCSGNDLTSLNVSGYTLLETLDCNANDLTSLDVSSCTLLEALYCWGNKLTSLDVGGCTSLTELDCGDNALTSLDVSSCTALSNLHCQSNSRGVTATDRTFDLSTLPGFDVARVKSVAGGTISGTVLTVTSAADAKGVATVTYVYDVGRDQTVTFILKIATGSATPVTPTDPSTHTHTLTYTAAFPATCRTEGSVTYWHCSGCGRNYADGTGATQLGSVVEAVNPANHANVVLQGAVAATAQSVGYTGDEYCLDCGQIVRAGMIIPITTDASQATAVPGPGAVTQGTETVTNADGSTTVTVTAEDGSKTAVTTKSSNGTRGSVTETVTEVKTDALGRVDSEKQTVTTTDGSGCTAVVTTETRDRDTEVTRSVELDTAAASRARSSGTAVTLPVTIEPGRNLASAPSVTISVPRAAGEIPVEIPVTNLSSGTVAVRVKNGSREIVRDCVPGTQGLVLRVNGTEEIQILDNTYTFYDTQSHWARDDIQFTAARGLFNGTSANLFSPEEKVNRAMLWTVLAHLNGADVSSRSAVWYDRAQSWAVSAGVSDGTNPTASITREQLVTMLWRNAGSPAADSASASSFADAASVSAYAVEAVNWAVGQGILTGVGEGRLDPGGTATRAQLAAMLTRFLKAIA